MNLLGGGSDLSGGSTQSSSLSATSLEADFLNQNSYGLPIQPNSNSQIAIQFDAATGWLAIASNSDNNIVKQTITSKGYYQFDIDGHLYSSDRSSASYWQSLEGATRDSLIGINFDGGLGYDTLIVGSQEYSHSFSAISDDKIQIQGEVYGETLFFKAKDIINQGSIIAGNVTAEFSDRYTDVADAKIIAIDGGSILLNGGKTSDLDATGQFLATGVVGGKIDFRGKTVSLRGANLDASGENGGGTILIGGDYQGSDPTGLGTLSNSQSTFIGKYSSINANALTSGNGGKVIIWSDGDTDFRGNITARGGLEIGDGGFVEVSGKRNLNFVGKVDVEAKNGAIGRILLDPDDIIINPDDDDDSTFDVSNLQDIIGDVTLSATNSITLNTDVYFKPSRGTVALQAGGRVSLFGYLWAGLHDINITAGSIVANARGAIFSNPYSGNGRSGNIKLVSQREIDFGQTTIFTESNSSSGNITLEAGTYITTGLLTAYGKNRGGNIKLTANGDIFTSSIRTFSAVANGGGKGGNISIVSTNGSINTTNNDSYGSNGTSLYTVGLNGNSGSVILEAYGDIITNEINTASYIDGNGGNVTLKSKVGKVDTNGKNIYTSSPKGIAGNVSISVEKDINIGDVSAGVNDAGDAIGQGGKVLLKGFGNITAGNITTASQSAGNAGSVNIQAGGDILTGAIASSTFAGSGNGGNIEIATVGNIESGNITTASNAGNAGNIKITAGSLTALDKNIKVGDLVASSAAGGDVAKNGGAISLSASGDIESGSITTESKNGAGGNINLLASGESIKVLNTLKQNDIDYSIISSGATTSGRITINRKSGSIGTFFAVGDATYNGTKGAIGAGKDVNGKDNSLLATTIVTGTYVDGNIRILTPDIPASSLSNPRTIPPETPTTTYSFAPVSSLNVQGFIDTRQYAKAIVALDNLRTIEFYQSQGNTSPTVPQLNSVNQIKNFLNAGDIATGTKSAMIYTFLSGTTQDNPSGTSLNLFAVTSTSDVIYRTIPLINKDLDSNVADFRSGVQNLDYDYESPGSNLYDLIIRPLKATLDLSQVNNLVFSTDNLFRTIPLAALYDKQARKFLVEDFSSSVAPSFQVIEKDRYKSLKSANVLKMGATVFGSSTPLASVRTELENIAQIELQNSPSIRHSPIYLNSQFSSNNLKTLIAKNDAPIVHFSTHGKTLSNSESYILLGSNNTSGQSDILNASDIRQLKDLSNKDLLVFSTCLSFTGSSYSTAGAALVAGVKSVIGCRWTVSDSATMVAMTGFYQQLLGEGLSKTKALQEAQKSMILGNVKVTDVAGTTDRAELSIKGTKVISSEYGQKNIKAMVIPKDLKHPFYWATFSLIGNPW